MNKGVCKIKIIVGTTLTQLFGNRDQNTCAFVVAFYMFLFRQTELLFFSRRNYYFSADYIFVLLPPIRIDF
jgi:hypothetical protein